MKKRIGFAALTVVLVAAAAATVFAANFFNVTFNNGGMDGIEIVGVETTAVGLTISYSATQAYGTVVFTFKSKAKTIVGLPVTKTWTNTEYITKPRDRSTWKFGLVDASRLESLEISVARK